MYKEPQWISLKAILAIHKEQIAEHGGISGIRDMGLLESVLDRPKNKFYYSNNNLIKKQDLIQFASSYAYGIIKNHPFFDGNKRVALISYQLFTKLNGISIFASPIEKYQTIMNLAHGSLSEEGFSNWLLKTDLQMIDS